MARKKKGIYCLEIGEWYGSLKRRCSVEPILSLLQDSPYHVPYIHRDIATVPELRYYIRKWIQGRHCNYPILYLAFHGCPGNLCLFKENGRPVEFSTEDLFELLGGECRGRVIHFGSCSVLDIGDHVKKRYLRESQALAISGYAESIDWVDSCVLDMLYLSELQKNHFSRAGIRAVKNRIQRKASQLGKSLKFQIRIKE